MRVSLYFLILSSLLVGMGGVIWAFHEPWRRDATNYSRGELGSTFPIPERWKKGIEWTSPDGARMIKGESETIDDAVYYIIIDVKTKEEQYKFPLGSGSPLGFYDSNTLFFRTDGNWNFEVASNDTFVIFHRRFPEYWYGHFYRLEIWGAIILILLLGIEGFRMNIGAGHLEASHKDSQSNLCPSYAKT